MPDSWQESIESARFKFRPLLKKIQFLAFKLQEVPTRTGFLTRRNHDYKMNSHTQWNTNSTLILTLPVLNDELKSINLGLVELRIIVR